jgi:hypothetical protein
VNLDYLKELYLGKNINEATLPVNNLVRVVRPFQPMTCEHNPVRVNFLVDDNNIITNITSG